MLSLLKNYYNKLPRKYLSILKYFPDILLYGSSYINTRKKISLGCEYFMKNLYDILNYSREYTSYGKENIPKKFCIDESFDVLKYLTFINSNDLADNLEYYTSSKFNSFNSYFTTTGGTGRFPTRILLSNSSYGREWAHMYSIWKTLGYSRRKNKKLTLRGKSLPEPKILDYNPIFNELIVDTFRLNARNFPVLLDGLSKHKIDFIHGYPSLVKEFITYCKSYYPEFNLKGIFLGSEGVSVLEKKEILDYFDCRVIHWYGQSEQVILAADLNCNGQFQVYSSYGYPYIHESDSTGFGEIIGTTFNNLALPLVNYRTGDYAKIIEKDNSLYLFDIIGRWGKDFVYLNKEKKIPTSSINIHSEVQSKIFFYQIHQKEYGQLLIKILPKKESRQIHNELIKAFSKEISEKLKEFNIIYKIVESEKEILRSKRGKMKMLVQHMDE